MSTFFRRIRSPKYAGDRKSSDEKLPEQLAGQSPSTPTVPSFPGQRQGKSIETEKIENAIYSEPAGGLEPGAMASGSSSKGYGHSFQPAPAGGGGSGDRRSGEEPFYSAPADMIGKREAPVPTSAAVRDRKMMFMHEKAMHQIQQQVAPPTESGHRRTHSFGQVIVCAYPILSPHLVLLELHLFLGFSYQPL